MSPGAPRGYRQSARPVRLSGSRTGCLAIAFWLSAASAGAEAPPLEETGAGQAFKAHQYEAALVEFQKLAADDPNNALVQRYLALTLDRLGRYREARATIGDIEPIVKATGDLILLSDLSSMRARYVIETSSWPLLAMESNFGNAYELFAIGMSAARTRNPTLASRALQALGQRAQDPREGDLRPAIAIMTQELAGLVALAEGRRDDGIGTLRLAAAAEAQLPAPLGLPAPIKPAIELLGEALVEAGRPAEAIPFFEAALKRNANRSLSLLGLARATKAAGQADASHRHYRALLANLAGADADVAALKEARAAVDTKK